MPPAHPTLDPAATDVLRSTSFRAAFESALDPMLVADDEARYVDANPAACEFFVLSLAELCERGVADFIPPDARPEFAATWQAFLGAGEQRGEYRLELPDGVIRDIEFSATANILPGRHLSILRDVSDRRRVERALESSERSLREAQRVAGLGSWEWDLETKEVLWSAEVFRILGLDPRSTEPSYELLIGLLPPERRGALQEEIKAVIAKKTGLTHEYPITRPDGTLRWIHSRLEVLVEDARAIRLLGTVQDITERKRAEHALSESHQRFAGAFENAPIGMALISLGQPEQRRLLEVNEAAATLLGYPQEDLVGRLTAEIIHPDDLSSGQSEMADLVSGERTIVELEKRFLRADGEVIVARLRASIVRGFDGKPLYMIGQLEDITERRRSQQARRESERRYRHLLETANVGIWTLDGATAEITFVNESLAKTLGYEREEMLGRTLYDFMDEDERRVAQAALGRQALEPNAEIEGRLRHRDGSEVFVEVRTSVARQGGGVILERLGMVKDVTGRRQAERQEHLLAAIVESSDDAILSKSLDGVVMTWNHGAERLYGYSAAEAVGRYIGALIIPAAHAVDHALISEKVAAGRTLRHYETERQRKDGTPVFVSLSASPLRDESGAVVGASVIERDISARRAAEEHAQNELDALAWVGRIRDALAEDRMVLFAQPIYDLATQEVVEQELLIRMRGTDGELVPPGTFLPPAEEYGLIGEIDRWVLRQAAMLAAQGQRVEVNLSAASVGDPQFLGVVERELHRSGADPSKIVFEITETALMQDGQVGHRFATQLTEIGCGFALDDFGTGYGSFTYLKQLPVQYLKIDIEFVRDLVTDPSNRHVVEAVVNLARGFGQKTVAEGVEDAQTLELLRQLWVDYAQGFHLGRPAEIAGQDSLHEPTSERRANDKRSEDERDRRAISATDTDVTPAEKRI